MDREERDYRLLSEARLALEKFRNSEDASGFPTLQNYLGKVNGHKNQITCFSLGGYGQLDKWKLDNEEYERMRSAYSDLEDASPNIRSSPP